MNKGFERDIKDEKKDSPKEKEPRALLSRIKAAVEKIDKESLGKFDKHQIAYYDGMRRAVAIIKEEIKEL